MNNRRGFTLIETLVAVMIMVGGLIVIGSSWSGNLMRIEKARVNANLAALLERKMVETDIAYRGKPLTEIKDEDSGEFEGPDYKNYRWEMRSKEFVMPDFSSAIGGSDGSNKEMLLMITKVVSEYVQKAVKEVTVTIYYKSTKARSKEIKQSAATYFVDYSKPLAFGGVSAGGG